MGGARGCRGTQVYDFLCMYINPPPPPPHHVLCKVVQISFLKNLHFSNDHYYYDHRYCYYYNYTGKGKCLEH